MPCYHPLHGYKSQELTKNGKRQWTSSSKKGYIDLPLTVPCGKCIGCRLDRSREWAARAVIESKMHEFNCFITLTYNDENLPPGKTLVKRDFQLFMKRFRKHAGIPIRYYHCGEYGDKDQRPHYHALIFGYDFPDKKLHSKGKSKKGHDIFKSETLEKLWGLGFCTISKLNYETAAYTARYVMKKITGEKAETHYRTINPDTGEVFDRLPEYATMSTNPGIGASFYEKFKTDFYPSDFLVVNRKKHPIPRYFDKRLKKENSRLLDQIKARRIKRAARLKSDSTPARLAVREEVQLAKIKTLKREL